MVRRAVLVAVSFLILSGTALATSWTQYEIRLSPGFPPGGLVVWVDATVADFRECIKMGGIPTKPEFFNYRGDFIRKVTCDAAGTDYETLLWERRERGKQITGKERVR